MHDEDGDNSVFIMQGVVTYLVIQRILFRLTGNVMSLIAAYQEKLGLALLVLLTDFISSVFLLVLLTGVRHEACV